MRLGVMQGGGRRLLFSQEQREAVRVEVGSTVLTTRYTANRIHAQLNTLAY